jgi:hypothetical protein
MKVSNPCSTSSRQGRTAAILVDGMMIKKATTLQNCEDLELQLFRRLVSLNVSHKDIINFEDSIVWVTDE